MLKQEQWQRPVFPALEKLRQKDQEFEVSWVYIERHKIEGRKEGGRGKMEKEFLFIEAVGNLILMCCS